MPKYQTGNFLHSVNQYGQGLTSFFADDGKFLFEEDLRTDPESWFKSRGFPMHIMSFPTVEEVESEARARSEELMSSWEILQKLCLCFEDIVRRRWVKKSRKSRELLLLQVFPKMPKEHNPSFPALLMNDSRLHGDQSGCVDEEAILWPFLNLEDLSNPKPFLLLLNARARNHPEIFVANDAQPLVLGHTIATLQRVHLHGYEMHLKKHDDPRNYAVLKSFTEDQMGSLSGMMPGDGLYVLKIQNKIMSFLANLCELLLHDLDKSSLNSLSDSAHLGSDIPDIHSSPVTNSSEYVSLAEVAADAAYQAPTSINLGVLEALVRSRLEAAQDHAWELRQDPTYYSDFVTQATTHFKGFGNNNAGLRNGSRTDWWLAIYLALNSAYVNVALWDEVCTMLHNVVLLEEKLHEDIATNSSDQWPQRYIQAIYDLGRCLNAASVGFRQKLRDTIYCSPPLCHLWEEADKEGWMPRFADDLLPKRAAIKDHFPALLSLLAMKNSQIVYPLHQITEHIERLLVADSHLRAKITPVVGDLLAIVQVLEEVRRQLYQYCPKLYSSARMSINPGIYMNVSQMYNEIEEPTGRLWRMQDAFHIVCESDQFAPINGKFYYPADKPRSRQHVMQMQRAEQLIDHLWSKVDEDLGKILEGKSFGDLIPAMDFSDRTLQRTPDWESTEKGGHNVRDPPNQPD